MPVGIITNVASVVIGGLLGAAMGGRLREPFKEKLNMVLGSCAMCMGISSIVKMENMPAVILAIILGTCIGLMVHLGEKINAAGKWMQAGMSRFVPAPQGLSRKEFDERLVTAIVLFCASGTGIYGAIVSGMNGDESVLLAKSVLDLPTALIFACTLGVVVSLVALPQLVIFLLLYYLAGVIFPLTTPAMIADFKACGGLIVFVTGFRMIRVKDFPVADMIPAMALVMPISWFWTVYILPVLS